MTTAMIKNLCASLTMSHHKQISGFSTGAQLCHIRPGPGTGSDTGCGRAAAVSGRATRVLKCKRIASTRVLKYRPAESEQKSALFFYTSNSGRSTLEPSQQH